MASKLNKKLEREIKVHGIEAPVIVALDPELGLSFRLAGSRTTVTSDWTHVISTCYTPNNVPSFLMGEPYKFLQDQARKKTKKIK